MKEFCLLLTVLLVTACDKPILSDTAYKDLDFTQTNTPKTGIANQDIISHVKVSGPDLCYNFAYFTVNKQQFLVDIHAIGTYPTKPVGCATALYYKDTTLSVSVTAAGTYVLRFYNGSQVFKSDTVVVN
ncbi:MAG: hypothetical protein ACXVMI_13985 [Flavisolibacter sp.]